MGWLTIRINGELVYSSHKIINSSNNTVDANGNRVYFEPDPPIMIPLYDLPEDEEKEEGE